MDPGLLFLAALLILVVLGIVVLLPIKRDQTRRDRLQGWAQRQGWRYLPRDDRWGRRLRGTPFGTGSRRRAGPVILGRVGQYPFAAFDYRYTPDDSPPGRSGWDPLDGLVRPSPVRFSVVALVLPAGLPWLEVTAGAPPRPRRSFPLTGGLPLNGGLPLTGSLPLVGARPRVAGPPRTAGPRAAGLPPGRMGVVHAGNLDARRARADGAGQRFGAVGGGSGPEADGDSPDPFGADRFPGAEALRGSWDGEPVTVHTDSAGFDRRFHVRTTDPDYARDLLHPEATAALLDVAGLGFRVDGRWLVGWWDGPHAPEDVAECVDGLARFAGLIPRFVWADHGYDREQWSRRGRGGGAGA